MWFIGLFYGCLIYGSIIGLYIKVSIVQLMKERETKIDQCDFDVEPGCNSWFARVLGLN